MIVSLLPARRRGGSEQFLGHVFQVSRADLDKALASCTRPHQAAAILDGFVAPEVSALEKYQRAYFQYKLEIVQRVQERRRCA